MEPRMDFLKCLENDLVLSILMLSGDPADLVRASAVSRDWQDLVIRSELCKQLCLSQFPLLVANVVDVHDITTRKRKRTESSRSERKLLSRNHTVYASLLHALQKLKPYPIDCIREKLSVSYYPSKGKKDADIPETVIFKLKYDQCVVTEIDMRPHQEYLQGIQEEDYSAKSVRFRMGFPKSARKKSNGNKDPADFIWTYTSPEFPINQKCKLLPWGGRGQRFELPEPVVCTGGYVMVELLGRVQMDALKGLYCIKISDVYVRGRSWAPAFTAKVQNSSGKFVLIYSSDKLGQTIRRPSMEEMMRPRVQRRSLATCACGCHEF